MAPWFTDKISEITGPTSTPEQCRINKELAENVFKKHYPPIEFSSERIPQFLRSESAATREWLSTALRSNTGHDRIFAMAYLVNLHPMNCLRYLDSLITLINPAKQRDCIRAIDVLHQLFDSSLIPKHRTMHPFNSRPVSLDTITTNPLEQQKTLCLWLFEERLKTSFHQFVKAMERLLLIDTVESFKRKALSTLSHLVLKSPENRSLILSIIINKLGDRSKVLASAVIHHLKKIVAMKRALTDLVVQEIRAFLFRPNLLERAKYYALVFLSCLELQGPQSRSTKSSATSSTALTLVRVYSAFFRSAVQSKEISEKLVLTLLTGLSRAAPFIPATQFDELLNEINDIFRLVHTSTFTVSLQALCVLFQLTTHKPDLRDRYYQALYRKLRDPQILCTSRGPSVLHLLYRSLMADSDPERGAAFGQRLLQLCLYHPSPGFVVGTLILLSKVNSQRNVFLTTTQPTIQSEDFKNLNSEVSEDEHFSDAPESDPDSPAVVPPHTKHKTPTADLVASWYHRRLANGKQDGEQTRKVGAQPDGYRPNAREPMFARAAGHPSWPLVTLTAHSHPTVSLFASMLLEGKPITYTGNPFDDFALLRFLDRFAFKKPKVIQKSGKRAPPCRRLQRHSTVNSGSRALAINSAMFRQLSADKVAADELFFHNYAKFLESRTGPKDQTGPAQDSDASVSDTEFDSYLEKYEKGLIPPEESDEDEADVEFDKADFSDDSMDQQDNDEDDEATFAEMDGLTPGSRSFLDDQPMDVDMNEFDEALVDLDSQRRRRTKKRNTKSSSSNLNELFASAEEVGRMLDSHESSGQRKRRLWEEKNILETKPKRPGPGAKWTSRRGTAGHAKKGHARASFAKQAFKHKRRGF